jgi:hypothetical protein
MASALRASKTVKFPERPSEVRFGHRRVLRIQICSLWVITNSAQF